MQIVIARTKKPSASRMEMAFGCAFVLLFSHGNQKHFSARNKKLVNLFDFRVSDGDL
jgi:hypothetical protein